MSGRAGKRLSDLLLSSRWHLRGQPIFFGRGRVAGGWLGKIAAGFLLFLLMLTLRLALSPLVGRMPFLVFVPGAIISAHFLGVRVTLLYTVMSALAGAWLFIPPVGLHVDEISAMAVFACVCMVSALFVRHLGRQMEALQLQLGHMESAIEEMSSRLGIAEEGINTWLVEPSYEQIDLFEMEVAAEGGARRTAGGAGPYLTIVR